MEQSYRGESIITIDTLLSNHDSHYYRCSWVKIGGIMYKQGDTLAISSDLMPSFGNILDILVVDVTQCFFVFELLLTTNFNVHFHAYEVTKQTQPMQIVVCKQSALIDPHVLGLYRVSNYMFVPLKYCIPENI